MRRNPSETTKLKIKNQERYRNLAYSDPFRILFRFSPHLKAHNTSQPTLRAKESACLRFIAISCLSLLMPKTASTQKGTAAFQMQNP